MRKLFNIVLCAGALVLSGCGDEQSNQAAAPAPAVSRTPAATASGNDTKMEKMEMTKKMEKMEKPAWAILEQNVYHYPE